MKTASAITNTPDNAKTIALQKLLDSSLDVICSFDSEGRFLQVSAAAYRVWGYHPDELLGTRYMDLVHPDDHIATRAASKAIASGVNVTNFENRYIKKDGTTIPILWSATWVPEEGIMYGVAKDATEKKELEQRLQTAAQMFENFMNNAPMVCWIADKEGELHFMNKRYREEMGLTTPDKRRSLFDIFPAQRAVDYYLKNLQVLKGGKAMEAVERIAAEDGVDKLVKMQTFPLQLDGVDVVGGWATDITEQANLQNSLEQCIERYHYVNEATSDAIYDWDLAKRKIYRGSGFQTLFGFPEEDVSLKYRLYRIHPDDQEHYKAVVFPAIRNLSTSAWEVAYRLQDANGNYRNVIDKAYIIHSDGKAVRVIGAIQDVTEQKLLQAKLIEQEKVAKRNIVRSIIEAQEKERRKLSVELHDNVNQMLASCKLMLEVAKDNVSTAPSLLEKCYNNLKTVICEIRKISHDLNPSLIEDLGLVEALKQMIDDINTSGKIKINLHTKVTRQRGFDEEEKITLFRIIQEQLSNILKHAEAKEVQIDLMATDDWVNLSIEDDGIGFDPSQLKKGLGFKNIINRVDYYNGMLQLNTQPGMGCQLHIAVAL